jgi:hypothetical protein
VTRAHLDNKIIVKRRIEATARDRFDQQQQRPAHRPRKTVDNIHSSERPMLR